MQKFLHGVAFLSLFLLSTLSAASQTTYQITNVGTLGGSITDAVSVNNSGQVVGASETSSGEVHPYFFDSVTGQLIDLGTFGGDNGRANGINQSGLVVGRAATTSAKNHAFLYDSVTGIRIDLHSVVTFGGENSSAVAINSNGEITGWADDAAGTVHAFLYRRASGQLLDLHLFTAVVGLTGSAAFDINDNGQIAGTVELSGGYVKSIIWKCTSSACSSRFGFTGTDSSLNAINNNGYAVGDYSNVGSTGTNTNASLIQDQFDGIDTGLVTPGVYSTANDINSNNVIVGSYVSGSPLASRASIAQFMATAVDLNTRLPAGSGWFLNDATAISGNGKIVGIGRFGNQYAAFIMVPSCSPGDIIVDGGFESSVIGGTTVTNSAWPSTSTNYGSSLWSTTFSPPGASRSGTFFTWFGGTSAAEVGSVQQTVLIPTGSAPVLKYWLRIAGVKAPFDSTMVVKVDGAIVQTIIEPSVAEGAYTQRTVALPTSYADGVSHSIRFEYTNPAGSGISNFFVDDVTLDASCPVATPTPSPTATPTPTPTPTPVFDPTSVTNTNDSGVGSLREAIGFANGNPDFNTIRFNIPGPGPYTINLLSGLPTLTTSMSIDATTEPGYAGKPIIELNGAGTGGANGLQITAPNCNVKGLVINRFNAGVNIVGGANETEIAGNYIGTDRSGMSALPNTSNGMNIQTAHNDIRGNLVSGNAVVGIMINGDAATGNHVTGNLVGTNADGTAPIVQFVGVQVYQAHNNVIGGTGATERNIISGNGAVNLLVMQNAAGNVIQGNFVGTNISGSASIGDQGAGILISNGAHDTIVGGTEPGARNVVSGAGRGSNNDEGVGIQIRDSNTTNNSVLGNYVGTDATGTVGIANLVGMAISDAPDNLIGGTEPGSGNVISGNNGGFVIRGENAARNIVRGNLIGLTAAGDTALGNQGQGLFIYYAPNNVIGGTEPGARNVISGNRYSNVGITGPLSTGNAIMGNYIGTDAAGTTGLYGPSSGIALADASSGTVIGGSDPAAGNLISGNGGSGVYLDSSTANTVRGNTIRSNNGDGITDVGSVGTSVSGNEISLNNASGVFVGCTGPSGVCSSGVSILTNSITSNGGQGITFSAGGNGSLPNAGQAAPTITSAKKLDAVNSFVSGSFNGTAGSSYSIQLFSNSVCDPSGSGEGQNYLTAIPVMTDASGNGVFSLPVAAQLGKVITATGTSSDGNTSRFSQCSTVTLPAPPAVVPTVTGTLGNGGWYLSNVDLTWSVSNPELLSGTTGCDASVVNSDTAGITFTCLATNAGGTTSNSVTIKRDGAAPTINAAATTSPNGAGWYNGNVTVHFTCSDAGSGIPLGACPGNQTLSAEDTAVSSSAQTMTDAAGNTSAASNVVTVKIDKTAPETNIVSAIDGNGALTAFGGSTLSNSITVAFVGSDALSLAGTQCSFDNAFYVSCSSPVVYPSLTLGSHTLIVKAFDAAGNVDSSPASFTWIIVTPAQASQNLGATIGNLGLPAAVANSLTAPLGQVSAILTDSNPNNDNAACGKLDAFINQVNAKVNNGQLTAAQGSQLLQSANAIKASLGCQ